ncbi:hypothetical protein HBI23_038460 [Parastagonospora nodorum]|nr:hypothetical protein HBH61_026810 [Parastagonospora nodorum]KAH5062375.1 hypothetical protein HBH96_065940 [Parastagonospora nodorum]KAH5687619.1 hypothetical protein HBI23_038460 [Parastagonospora nodorum]
MMSKDKGSAAASKMGVKGQDSDRLAHKARARNDTASQPKDREAQIDSADNKPDISTPSNTSRKLVDKSLAPLPLAIDLACNFDTLAPADSERTKVAFFETLLGFKYDELRNDYAVVVYQVGDPLLATVTIDVRNINTSESELHPSLKFGQRLERPEKESTAIVTKQDAASEDTSGRKTVSKASTKTTTITSRDKNTDGFPQAKRLPDKDIDKKRRVEDSPASTTAEKRAKTRGHSRFLPANLPVDYRPPKPKYQNDCPRLESGKDCDRHRCECLHEDQREYFHSEQYKEDGWPWQHAAPQIFDLGQLRIANRRKKL